jgi:integrase
MSDRKLLGQADWHGKSLTFRLSRSADPARKRRNIRDYYNGALPDDRLLAKKFAHEFAHRMSLEILEKGATQAVAAQGSKDETVSEWCKRWRAWRVKMGYVKSESEDSKNFRNHIEPLIGGLPMRLVSAANIEAVVERLDARIVDPEKPMSWKTARNAWVCLRAMFRDAVTAKPSSKLRVDREDNPTLTVAPPEKPKKGSREKLKTFLYPSEYLELMTAPAIWDPDQGEAKTRSANVARAKAAQRWMRIFTIAIYMSVRGKELKALTWEWTDLEHWVAKIEMQASSNADHRRTGRDAEDPKCGSFREFDIEPELRPLLLAMFHEARAANGGRTPSGRIFPTFPTEKDLARRLRKYLELAKCTRPELSTRNAHRVPMRFHDLRATGITWMAMRGDDAIHIQELAGHKSLVTTEKYIRKVNRLRGADWGAPFPPIPAMVIGASNVIEKPEARQTIASGARTSEAAPTAAWPQSGPNLAPEIAKVAKQQRKIASPRGFEASTQAKSPGKQGCLGPSGPRNARLRRSLVRPDGAVVHRILDANDPIAEALERGHDEAAAAKDWDRARALAAALADHHKALTAPNVVPLARGARRGS